MEHFIQKFADGSSQEMVRAFASMPFVIKAAGMSDSEVLRKADPSKDHDRQLYEEAIENANLGVGASVIRNGTRTPPVSWRT